MVVGVAVATHNLDVCCDAACVHLKLNNTNATTTDACADKCADNRDAGSRRWRRHREP